MKILRTLTVLLLFPFVLPATTAIPYRVGDIVTEVTNLVDRATGQIVPLSQLEGKILFLDFFAHWCPVCRAAAPQILHEIDEWYDSRAGNLDGIPVLHIGVNLQSDSNNANRLATTRFVTTYKFPLTIQDTSRHLQARFGPTSGQPTFAIINGVTNSPTHRPWELLYARFSYLDSTQNRPIDDFRAAIDSVQAPPPVLHDLVVEPTGALRLSVFGARQRSLVVEWSNDLKQWQRMETTIPADAIFPYVLPPPNIASAAFLRVRRVN